MENLRIHPKAVAKQLLHRLEDQPILSHQDEIRILYALENCNVPHAVDRLMAQMSRGVVSKLLESI
jgi:hypothetical protein